MTVSWVVQVDLVGHAWFMNKCYVKYMWFEEPLHWDNGEDWQIVNTLGKTEA